MSGREVILREAVRLAEDQPVGPRSFWRKLRRVAARLPFLDDLLAAYWCALDPATPKHVKAALFGALAYFVLPADLIPDIFAKVGFTDDLAVLMATVGAVKGHIAERHRAKARRTLARLAD
jgi:uncharacterized membrane protein YkvA (DUF1232 family)